MDEQIQRDINALLNHWEFLSDVPITGQGRAEAAEEDTTPPGEQPESQHAPPQLPPIIVYLVDTPPPETYDDYAQDCYPDIVESTSKTGEEGPSTTPTAERKEEVPLPPLRKDTPFSAITPRHESRRGVLVGVLCLLLAGAAITAFLLSPLTDSATITILPQAREITTTTMLTVVTNGTTNLLEHEIAGRRLSSLTLSQEQTVSTTGTGHEDAQAAHGLITFYNASLSGQAVPTGALLTGADGVQVVTDQDAVIPAGSLSTNGQFTVAAHAVQAGPAGNIRAGDIYGPCCRLNVFAQNSRAFRGGQDASTFPTVTQADINGAVASLKASLMQSGEAAFQAQVHSDETLLVPSCTPTVTATHAVGEEATSLGVTVDETCTDEAYNTQRLHDLIAQLVTAEAVRSLGAGYSLTGRILASVVESSLKEKRPGAISLQVKGAGIWTYQFSEAALEHLAWRIAGKSPKEARKILLGVPGVQSVSIQMSGGTGATLPDNPAQIRVEQLVGLGL